MTMAFKPPPTGMPGNVTVGGTVAFEFRLGKDGLFEISTIGPVAATTTTKASSGEARDIKRITK